MFVIEDHDHPTRREISEDVFDAIEARGIRHDAAPSKRST
jgi:hypothetical protein